MKYSKSTYEPFAEGDHHARLIGVIDLGTQNTPYGTKGQVLLQYDLVNERTNTGAARTKYVFYTKTCSPKGNLYADLKGILGRNPDPDDFARIDRLLGTPVVVTIEHVETMKGTTRDIVKRVHPLNGDCTGSLLEPLFFDLESDDAMAQFQQLPEWVQTIVQQSLEWQVHLHAA